MRASDYIASFLKRKGIPCVFELVGGMITFLVDSIDRAGGIRIVSVHHEQGAAFAAEGFGRMTGLPGVALATSGPGATNLITGIGSCHFDSTPALFITGQVNRHEMKGNRPIRQLGFQETDIVSIARPITKAAWQVNDPAELPSLLERAFALALEGRPGPVLLDIPLDIQRAEIDPAPHALSPAAPPDAAPIEAFAAAFLERLAAADRPLVLAGGGIRSAHAAPSLRAFTTALGLPVVHSLMGVDLLPHADPLRVGMIGSYGNRYSNHALSRSDLLLVLGSRLDIRQTGSDIASFGAGREIWHVDCDPGEINNRITGCHALQAPLLPFLKTAARLASEAAPPKIAGWREEIAGWKALWPDTRETSGQSGINPNEFIHALSRASSAAAAWAVDVGQHQMWAAQSAELGPDQRFLTSGGMGSMGFALPAAIGACYGAGHGAGTGPVVVLAGDGGFQCNIQELQTVARNRLPLKMVILNNRCHGMVRQFQEAYFNERYISTVWGYDAPDFAAVAAAYGIPGRRIAKPAETDEALAWLWNDPASPALLEVGIETRVNAYPKIAFGRPISEMEPLVAPIGMEST